MDETNLPVSTDIELTPIEPPSAPPPRVWTVFLAILTAAMIAAFFQVVFVVVLIAVEAARGGDAMEFPEDLTEQVATPAMFMLLAASAQLAFAVAAIVPAWLSPVPFGERLGLVRPRQSAGVVALAVVGSWASLAVGIGFAYALANWVEPDPMIEQLYKNITIAEAIPFVIFIAVVPGIVEELLFRGYVQRRLLERWTPGVAITVTSLLFALVHVQPHHVVAAFPMGLWLGVVAWKTGSVFPSMLCHAFINGSLNAWRMVAKFGNIPEDTQQIVNTAGVAVGLVCFMLAVRGFLRNNDESGRGVDVVSG